MLKFKIWSDAGGLFLRYTLTSTNGPVNFLAWNHILSFARFGSKIFVPKSVIQQVYRTQLPASFLLLLQDFTFWGFNGLFSRLLHYYLEHTEMEGLLLRINLMIVKLDTRVNCTLPKVWRFDQDPAFNPHCLSSRRCNKRVLSNWANSISRKDEIYNLHRELLKSIKILISLNYSFEN